MRLRSFTLVVMLIMASPFCMAQLRIDSLGQVGIGTIPANKPLTIRSNGFQALYIDNYQDSQSSATGMYVMGAGSSNSNYYGIYSVTGCSSSQNISVCGMIPGTPAGNPKMAAILGSSYMSTNMLHSGAYAGYFLGNVRVTGLAYASIISPSSISSTSQISFLSHTDNISKKLIDIDVIKVINKDKVQLLKVDEVAKENLRDRGMDVPEYVEVNEPLINQTRYEVVPEQLAKEFPELIYMDDDGKTGINYTDMIPLLLQSIKELKAEIEDLKHQLDSK